MRINLSPLSCLVIVAASLVIGPPHEAAARPQTAANAATTPTAAAATFPDTPDGAMRAFLISMVKRDSATLRAVVVPVSGADFQYLVSSFGHTPAGYIPSIVKSFSTLPIQVLASGQSVTLPRGRPMTVPAGAVGPNRALVLPQGVLRPILIIRVNGRWRVDPATYIADRRTADQTAAERLAAARRIPPHPHSPMFGTGGVVKTGQQ